MTMTRTMTRTMTWAWAGMVRHRRRLAISNVRVLATQKLGLEFGLRCRHRSDGFGETSDKLSQLLNLDAICMTLSLDGADLLLCLTMNISCNTLSSSDSQLSEGRSDIVVQKRSKVLFETERNTLGQRLRHQLEKLRLLQSLANRIRKSLVQLFW